MMLLQMKHFRDAVYERAQSAVFVHVRVDGAPVVDLELCIGWASYNMLKQCDVVQFHCHRHGTVLK